MKTRSVIITICCFDVLILGAALLVRGDDIPKPPKLTVSNEYGQKIEAQQGTYSWTDGNRTIFADSQGPLGLYNLGELKSIETSENDDYSLDLKFGTAPESISVAIYPKSSAETNDYGAMITPPVSGSLAEYKFRTPDDSIYIVEVYAKYEKGNCYYYFYTTP
ncbi:MAG: hypothetical protein II185_03360 [Firmicutes bacterium]|nr:hypothetical protein [Bacillota bacterium]